VVLLRFRWRSATHPAGRRQAARLAACSSICALVALAPTSVGAATGDVGDVGYQDFPFSGTSTPTGTKRAESVLWWNDGAWWSSMWSSAAHQFRIFKLDTPTQTWTDSGVPIDTRANTHADVLWDGAHLYVASHQFVADENPAVAGYASYLFRFGYDPATKRYALDAGFPVQINNYKTETLVIDKDSTGKLWATWQQGNQIYVNRTVGGDDHTWGTPFALPVAGTSVTVDDNSALVAFGGNKIGLMWSNQTVDAMYFAVHDDGQPDNSWQASRTVIQGPGSADDHINLKSAQADGSGRVYAAVKTSFTSSSAPLIMLLVRDPASGDWSSYPIARVSDCPNRPLVTIDEENRVLHTFFTAPAPPGYSCNSSGGAIYEKTSPLDAISFPLGYGTLVMKDADSPYIHNVNSSKQNVNSTTDLALLAVNAQTSYYWHAFQPITPAGPPPPPVADFTATPVSGTAPLSVSFTDLSTGSPATWSWNFGDGSTSTQQDPAHIYASAGSYTVTLNVTNAAGSDTKTRIDYISASQPPAPTADFAATPTSGTAPLPVSFTDLSTGSPTTWSWNFGDGSTSTQQNPAHTYAGAGSYTVALTVANSTGSNTRTLVDYITVTPPPPEFILSVSPARQIVVRGASTNYTVSVTPVNGFAGSVSLAISGLPSGAAGTFDVNPVVPPTSISTLTVRTSSTTKHGNYTLRITGTSGSLLHATTVNLQVKRN
jgi:PKD repeat protein